MLGASVAVIALVRSRWAIALLLVVLLCFAIRLEQSSKMHIQLGDKIITLEIADTDFARVQGLSGRPKLGDNQGMLFVFDTSGTHCFWMKDMQFSLDMIWLDEQKSIIDIKERVSPDTFPEEFCPSSPAWYVLELNAGVAAKLELKVGQQLNL